MNTVVVFAMSIFPQRESFFIQTKTNLRGWAINVKSVTVSITQKGKEKGVKG